MKQQNTGFVNTFRNIYFKFVFAPGGAALTEIVPSSTSCDSHGTRSWSRARFEARGEIGYITAAAPGSSQHSCGRRPGFRTPYCKLTCGSTTEEGS
jgi:hypothetical protein